MQSSIFTYETCEEVMKAIVNGDIELDKAEQLATTCAELADEALVTKRPSHKPQFSSTIPGYVEQLLQNANSTSEDIERIKKAIIDCGKAADAVKNAKPVGATK